MSDRKQDNRKLHDKPLTNIYTSVQELSCAFTILRSDVIDLCVVPVEIRHPYSSKVLDTYEMLGNCIEGTFVKKSKSLRHWLLMDLTLK